ncbi:hypothetical protein DLAC_03723 [Tieghemostelium lacteum]|uniref:Pectin lyase-like family protein n=1 Tax=Tieghemostelium lacteum TaxID=361077 RepID=A0A152A0P8_TIELA|nr:hypothetical protein DLAC_03723 [Tieghemostelium lacteum]|eukprot:KYQ99778.1 hypothetical protein DLAC_03723 [Tieghemostelium lacteum]
MLISFFNKKRFIIFSILLIITLINNSGATAFSLVINNSNSSSSSNTNSNSSSSSSDIPTPTPTPIINTTICEAYINLTTPNTSLLCGTESNPCMNILDALSYCNQTTLAPLTIRLYFGNGIYSATNNTGIKVFNQSVSIQPLSTSIPSLVTFNFSNSNQPFIELIEPPTTTTPTTISSGNTTTPSVVSTTITTTNITLNNINVVGLQTLLNGSLINFESQHSSGNIVIMNSTFVNCTGAYGGLVYIQSQYQPQMVSLQVYTSNFTNTSADIGGVFYTAGQVQTSVNGSQFLGNNATYGTIIYSQLGQTKFANSLFQQNLAVELGLIFLSQQASQSYQQFQNLTFQNNEGTTNKTSNIYLCDSSISLQNSIFQRNSLTALWSQNPLAQNPTPTLIEYCMFLNNNITSGSASCLRSDVNAQIQVMKSQFINNTAFNAGAVLINNSMSFSCASSVFSNNAAENNGGVFYTNNTASIEFTSLVFTANTAVNSGSSIYCVNSTINFLNNSTFANNADRFDSDGFGIGCGSGEVCKFKGSLSSQDSYCSSYFPNKTKTLTKGQEAGIIIGVIGAVIIICIGVILLIKKFSRFKLSRRGYKLIN